VLALGISACGSDADSDSKPRPPAPIVVGVQIDNQQVRVSPRRFGAGPIALVISNQSASSQQVTLETSGSDKGERPVQTGPISPRETASIKATVLQGSYALRVGEGGVRPARLLVEGMRPTAQNDLLQP
jgi:hypothetical protein